MYLQSLQTQIAAYKSVFEPVQTYIASVNEFLQGKELVIDDTLSVRLRNTFPEQDVSEFKQLSSGERQVVTMLYACVQNRRGGVVLIDEPEISLHIDWQRILLSRMKRQLGERQIVVCTHSIQIATDYDDFLQILEPRPTSLPVRA